MKRYAWLLPILVFIVGPVPGEVGSCGDDAQFADARAFCIDMERWICARQHFRGELTDAERDMCFFQAESMRCPEGTAWDPVSCNPPPTTSRTQTCLDALASQERITDPDRGFPECQFDTLCSGSAALTEELSSEEVAP